MKILLPYTSELSGALQNGAVGVLPTDTVYGLVCQASNSQAVSRLYSIKARKNGKPGTVIAASIKQLVDLGLTYRYLKAVDQFWPGPISVIIPCATELSHIHLGLKSIAVRIPDNKSLTTLLAQTGPLLTTSANHPNEPTAKTLKDAKAIFKDQVDFYIDGGDMSNHLPSTVIRLIDDYVDVIRPGASLAA